MNDLSTASDDGLAPIVGDAVWHGPSLAEMTRPRFGRRWQRRRHQDAVSLHRELH